MDEETDEPIFFVNVFLSNTTVGTTTDENGHYLIKNALPGAHDLVFQHIGYEIAVIMVHFIKDGSLRLDVRLKPKVIQAKEVSITARYPNEWKQQLEEFKKSFLGKTENAKKCKILNPEVLEFKRDATTHTTTAFSDSVLIVENQALAYLIHNYIEYLTWSQNFIRHRVLSLFEPLTPNSDEQLRNWVKKRQQAFQGSLKHFLSAFARENIVQEGFRLRQGDLDELKLGWGKRLPADSLYVWSRQSQFVDGRKPANSLVFKKLYFKDWLRVVYKTSSLAVNNYLNLNEDVALIDSLGNIINAVDIKLAGDWGLKLMADRLPSDYHPFVSRTGMAAKSLSLLDSLDCVYLECIFSKISEPEKATKTFNEGLNDLRKPSAANADKLKRLELDTRDIMTKEEWKRYRSLKSAPEKAVFFKQFWLNQDLTLATRTNERLVEHYARLAYARQRYRSLFQTRGYDDRGVVYLKYGQPDNTVIDLMPGGASLYISPIETWAYYGIVPGEPLIFDFVEKVGIYRLATSISDDLPPGDPADYLDALEELTSGRAFLSMEYLSLHTAVMKAIEVRESPGAFARAVDKVERAISSYEAATQSGQAQSPPILTDVFRKTRNLHFAGLGLAFRDAANAYHVVGVYGIRPSEVKDLGKEKGGKLILRSALRNSNRALLASQIDTLMMSPEEVQDSGAFGGTVQYLIPEGKYILALEVNDKAQRLRGMRNFTIATSELTGDGLNLSDVLFASSVLPRSELKSTQGEIVRGDLVISPHRFRQIDREAPPFIYFEVYDLLQDPGGQTHFDIEYEVSERKKEGFLAKLNPFDKQGKSLSVSESRLGNSRDRQIFLQLDFRHLPKGEYELTVRVQDKRAKMERVRRLEFAIVD